jgi:YHS domain-containing protein
MKLLSIALVALALAAAPAFGQMSCCGPGGMAASASTGGLAGLKLVSLAGDTVDLSQHTGMMPMLMLLAGTDAASGKAADVVQATVSAREPQPMLVYVLAAGPKATRAFAKTHNLTGLVLVDQKKTALAAAMADTLPVVLFIDRSGKIVKAEATITDATVSKGVKAMAQTEEKLVDPVCGMTVTKEGAAGSTTYQGKTYYFCSKACKDNFSKDPQKYLAR